MFLLFNLLNYQFSGLGCMCAYGTKDSCERWVSFSTSAGSNSARSLGLDGWPLHSLSRLSGCNWLNSFCALIFISFSPMEFSLLIIFFYVFVCVCVYLRACVCTYVFVYVCICGCVYT